MAVICIKQLATCLAHWSYHVLEQAQMYAHVPKRTTHFFGGALMDSDTFAFICGACGAGYSSLNPTTTLSQCEHGKPHKGKTGRGISTKLGRAHSKSSRAASSSASTSSSMFISSPRDRLSLSSLPSAICELVAS